MRRAAILLLVLLLGGCGSDDPAPTPTAQPTPTSASSASTTPTESPFQTLRGPLARCGPQPAALGGADLRHQVLHDPVAGRIPTVVSGRGHTVAVLLHQTDGNGLCGWLEYVPALVSDRDVAVLAIDVCPYGAARCAEDVEPMDVVGAAVRHARVSMHADRVVVVGASMGGSLALMSAALQDVDAAVDLSGPIDWPGMSRVRGGRAIGVPVLVAMADEEGAAEVAAARRIVARAPEGSRFLPVATGHGYDLVEPFLAELRRWVDVD